MLPLALLWAYWWLSPPPLHTSLMRTLALMIPRLHEIHFSGLSPCKAFAGLLDDCARIVQQHASPEHGVYAPPWAQPCALHEEMLSPALHMHGASTAAMLG